MINSTSVMAQMAWIGRPALEKPSMKMASDIFQADYRFPVAARDADCLHRMSSVLRPGAVRRTARTYTIRSAPATS